MREVVEAGAVLQRGKRRGIIPGECAGGSAQRKGSPAARREWGKHK